MVVNSGKPRQANLIVPSRRIEKEYLHELSEQHELIEQQAGVHNSWENHGSWENRDSQENHDSRESRVIISHAEIATPAIPDSDRGSCLERESLIYLAGVDEVGRGALAGPVGVGIAVVSSKTSDSFPAGLRDSKQLTPMAREALIEPCSQWVHAWAVGMAEPDEINSYGIIPALRIAAARAVQTLASKNVTIDAVLLDGSHNWWSPTGLFDVGAGGQVLGAASGVSAAGGLNVPQPPDLPVRTVVKGDAQCAVVAAASVFAKITRDACMVHLAERYPEYGWESNKGYSSPAHIAALKQIGPSVQHRTAWKLPGLARENK